MFKAYELGMIAVKIKLPRDHPIGAFGINHHKVSACNVVLVKQRLQRKARRRDFHDIAPLQFWKGFQEARIVQ